MNRCGRFARQIDDYVTGRCGPATVRWMATHARSCAGCRQAEATAREMRTTVRAALEQVQAEAPSSAGAFLAALHAQLAPRALQADTGWRPFRWAGLTFPWRAAPIGWIALRGSGAVVLLVAALGLLRPGWHRGRSTAPRAAGIVQGPRPGSRPVISRDTNIRSSREAPRVASAQMAGRATRAPASTSSPKEAQARGSAPPFGSGPHADRTRALRVSPHTHAGLTQRPRPSRDEELAYLNGDPLAKTRRWTALSPDEWDTLEARVRRGVAVRDDFVRVPFPRLADVSGRQIASAVQSYQREAAVVDARLAREVTLQQKGTALADLCERLRSETGIPLSAGQSVADEKVTVFCEKLPLREVMRQLSRPFGYTWIRSGKPGEYRYELVQDLRSQLLEEELRNRDRNEALLALEREIDRYRPYLNLTPDEALARVKTASPGEKPLLEKLSSWGWGPIQMYFRLSRSDMQALRAGQSLRFSGAPKPGERPLPPDVARGVFQAFREWRVATTEGGYEFGPAPISGPNGVPIATIADARALVTVALEQSELGQFTLGGLSAALTVGERAKEIRSQMGAPPYAVGRSAAALKPRNGAVNARLAADPALRVRVTVHPQPSCIGVNLSPIPSPKRGGVPVPGSGLPQPAGAQRRALSGTADKLPLPASGRRDGGAASWPRSGQRRGPGPGRVLAAERTAAGAGPREGGEVPVPKVTTADVLEALHHSTGMPIVADYYTRLYRPEEVSVSQGTLFDALNRLGDAMRLRWDREGSWLQFRSTTFYDDRLKEVPDRLLAHWAAARQQHGMLTLDDLVEIAQLPDAQLDAAEMAEGARLCYGLTEWGLARNDGARVHLRYLAGFTLAQRQEAVSPTGLRFLRMPLAQQQRFMQLAFHPEAPPLQSLEELSDATLRVEYTQPGQFQWGDPGMYYSWTRWVVPIEPGRDGRRVVRPPVQERTREAALQALLRLDPRVRQAALHTHVPPGVALDPTERTPPLEAQIFPTELSLTFVYIPSTANARRIRISHDGMTNYQLSW
jgi:hypothetical protein